jgi:hypothetical protein
VQSPSLQNDTRVVAGEELKVGIPCPRMASGLGENVQSSGSSILTPKTLQTYSAHATLARSAVAVIQTREAAVSKTPTVTMIRNRQNIDQNFTLGQNFTVQNGDVIHVEICIFEWGG